MNLPARTAVVWIGVLAISGTGCQSSPTSSGDIAARYAAENNALSDLSLLAAWMRGSFSSAAQAARDPEFKDLRLELAPIWPHLTDGYWFYVEQAAGNDLQHPYRQRVYQLVATPGGAFESRVFELPGDALTWAGAFREPARFDGLTPSRLTPLTGCTVRLTREGGAFVGSTVGNGCPSTLRGAAFGQSQVAITPIGIQTLDQGFDSTGKQIPGDGKGPYEFLKARAEAVSE
ncbi:MAG: chromophore lyase CpcT/CpeT [Phycisphaerae bacterium]